MTYIVVVLTVIIFILVYLLYINVQKFNSIEIIASEIQDENQQLLDFISELNRRLYTDFEHLKEIDKRGSFESDDEVGFVFNTIKNIIEDSFVFVNNFINPSNLNEQEESEE
jgi:predicted PurR-regulated permease PerM